MFLQLIILGVIILNFICKKQKVIHFVNFFLMWILLGWSYGSYDTMIHIRRYEYPDIYKSFTEYGFSAIVNLFNYFGFHYRFFFVVMAFLIVSILCFFIKRYCFNAGIVYTLFYLLQMGYVFCQLRYLFAFSIVLIAIHMLLTKRQKVCYVILILLATLIHYSMFFFIIYLFIPEKRKISYSIQLTIIGVFFVSLCITFLLPLLLKVDLFASKLGMVLTGTFDEGLYKYVGMYIGLYLLLLFYIVYINRSKVFNEFDEYVIAMNILNIISIPLMFNVSIFFLRIILYFQILNYIMYSNSLGNEKKIYRYKLEGIIILFCSFVVLHKVFYWDYDFINKTVLPLIRDNVLFSK